MLRSELVAKLAEENPGLSRAALETVVRSVFDAITEQLASFGVFSVRKRDARVGRNPRSGKAVQVAEKSVPHFKIGKELRDRLNAADA